MGPAHQRHNAHAPFLELLGDFDRHDVRAARRDNERGVDWLERVVAQNALGETGDVFEKHRLTLPIGADDKVMKRQRKLDYRIEAGERAVARPHFLNHDARMTRAEEMDHAAGKDRLRKPIGRLENLRELGSYGVE